MDDVNAKQKSLSSYISNMSRILFGNLFKAFEQHSSDFLGIFVQFLLVDCIDNCKTYLCLHVSSGEGIEPSMFDD